MNQRDPPLLPPMPSPSDLQAPSPPLPPAATTFYVLTEPATALLTSACHHYPRLRVATGSSWSRLLPCNELLVWRSRLEAGLGGARKPYLIQDIAFLSYLAAWVVRGNRPYLIQDIASFSVINLLSSILPEILRVAWELIQLI